MTKPPLEVPYYKPLDIPTDPFKSDIRAFDILADHGLNDMGINLIKDQVQRLSAGYRKPENKLRDVLVGGAVLVDDDNLLLLHGFGSLDRGAGSGECSEAVRSLTSEWARSSQHRHIAKAGFHPFYLEVAAPVLFDQTWDDGHRIRSGHSVLALGPPVEYLESSGDESFVLLDPTLGVIEPMATSAYRQTGFVVVPEREKRPQMISLNMGRDDGTPSRQRPESIQPLVLGIDERAQFIYLLWFKRSAAGPAAQIEVVDNTHATVANFDSSTQHLVVNTTDKKIWEQAQPTLLKLTSVFEKQGFDIWHDLEVTGRQLIVNGQSFEVFKDVLYPRDTKIADYILGLEHAAEQAAQEGTSFSLKFNEC